MPGVLGALALPLGLLTAPTVAFGLIAGFGVAEATGVRALGGVVLIAIGIIAGLVWLKRDGAAITCGLSVVYLGCFAVSHLLAQWSGSWPAVFMASAVCAIACYLISDRWRHQRIPAASNAS